MTADDDILAGLRPNYLARLEARLCIIRAFVATLENEIPGVEEKAELHRIAHSMASSASIFGHAGLSAAARYAEQIFESSKGDVIAQRASLSCLMEEAQRVLETGA